MPSNDSSRRAALILVHCGIVCCALLQATQAEILLVSGSHSNYIKRYDLATGAYTGNFANLSLDDPYYGVPVGLTVGPFEDIIVTDPGSMTLRRYDMHTGAPLAPAPGIVGADGGDIEYHASDNSLIWIGDRNILVKSNESHYAYPCGNDGEPGRAYGMTIGPDGDLYVTCADDFSDASSIVRVDLDTFTYVGNFATGGIGSYLYGPRDLVFGPDGNLYVSNTGTGSVLRYNGVTGAFIDEFAAGLGEPWGLGFGEDGDLYVADHENNLIYRRDGVTGAPVGALPSGGLNGPTHLIVIPEPSVALLTLLGATVLRRRRFRRA